MSSSVFLSNVDDYVAPSQACVNPLFSEKTNATSSNNTTTEKAEAPAPGTVVARRRRRGGAGGGASSLRAGRDNGDMSTIMGGEEEDSTKEAVKASIADCLACSGCVTTAETVLLEETHSLQLLRNKWNSRRDDNNNNNEIMVATISPAAWADLFRHVGGDVVQARNTSNAANVADTTTAAFRQGQRQWVSLLAQTLGVTHVLDGNVPLQWSLEAAAIEFCQAYRSQQRQQQSLPASLASTLSSSCPAVVCLVEKSSHGAVPHLSTTPSPQGVAGIFWKHAVAKTKTPQVTTTTTTTRPFHVAIMPCHDKKLEASRPALLQSASSNNGATTTNDVDLVLTTQDCVKLILERLQQQQKEVTNTNGNASNDSGVVSKSNTDDDDEDSSIQILQSALQQCSPSHVVELDMNTMTQAPSTLSKEPTLWTPPLAQLQCTHAHEVSSNKNNNNNDAPFVYGSGGYADYIFRRAAQELFGVVGLPAPLPWKVVVEGRRRVSARVAASARDYYQVALYRQPDGSYTCTEPPHVNGGGGHGGDGNNNQPEPVLKFAIAYGMQTLQRVLTPYENSKKASGVGGDEQQPSTLPYHYVEAMACPSGCVNGGGQLRLATTAGPERPTQTQERVQRTRQQFVRPAVASSEAGATASHLLPPWMTQALSSSQPLQFKAVPPLQLNQGAVKGIAVQDVQW